MMNAGQVAAWMLAMVHRDGCLYQDDVVDMLVKAQAEHLLRENNDGNQALSSEVLDEFRRLTEVSVVWVKPGRYWRWRVTEDDTSREARG